ncbi:MAG: sulfur carrier protein ThiS [Pseudomonadales bacterium]
MISIYLNNDPVEIEDHSSLTQLLKSLDTKPVGFAIAVNETFIPRSEHQQMQLQTGDRVELLVPTQGG